MDYCGKCNFLDEKLDCKNIFTAKARVFTSFPTQDFLNSRIRLNKPKGKTGCHSSETLSSLYSLTTKPLKISHTEAPKSKLVNKRESPDYLFERWWCLEEENPIPGNLPTETPSEPISANLMDSIST